MFGVSGAPRKWVNNLINAIKGDGWTNETIKGNATSIASFANKYYTDDFYIPAQRIDSYATTMEDLTAAEIYAKWDALVAEFPNLMTKTLLGKDHSDTLDIFKIEVSPANPTYKLLVIANQHGNGENGDPTEPAVAMYEFIKDIYYNHTRDKICKWIYDNIHFVINPVANPWGVNNKSRFNSRTVDINRNYAFCYDNGGSGMAGGAFSEKESQYVRWLLISNLDADGFIDIHAYGTSKTIYKYPSLAASEEGRGIETLSKVSEYLAEKYDTTAQVEATTLIPAAKNYAREITGIEAVTLEFPVYTVNVLTHGADMMTKCTEWYGNVLYAWVKGLTKTVREYYNLAVYNPETWDEWVIETNAAIVDSKLVITGNSTSKVTYLDAMIKTNTKYGLLIKSEGNTITDANGLRIASNLTGSTLTDVVPNGYNGVSKCVFTTQATINSFPNQLRFSLAATATSGSVTLSDIRMFELTLGSEIEADFTNLTAAQLNAKYPA